LKILYISPEHISGTLSLFCEGHNKFGNYARYVTMFPSGYEFPEDMMMNLPMYPDKNWIKKGRDFVRKLRGTYGDYRPEGKPPIWESGGKLESMFFEFRDSMIESTVYDFMDSFKLWDFDVYQYEQGLDFFRDSRVLKKLKSMGKKIVCFYHGNDVRNRGVIKEFYEHSDLNLTSELDLLEIYPGIKYLFLPIDTAKIKPVPHNNKKIKIAHATRNRYNKSSDYILEVVGKLEKKLPVEMVLIENVHHEKCMEIKSTCDICIDQVGDKAGWGYGMSSVESLAQGLATCTFLNEKYIEFIPDNCFINVNYENLETELEKLIVDNDYRKAMGAKGREWVTRYHNIDAVMKNLYDYYKESGING
jgi:hypothetical protein